MSERSVDYYKGESGERYFETVLGMDRRTRETIAKVRALKIQPWIDPGESILEYGVGTGLNLARLRCARKVGYDISEYGREVCEADGIEFFTNIADLEGVTFPVVLSHHSLEHVERPMDILREIRERVEPRGKLLLFVPYERSLPYRPEDPNRHLYSWTRQTLGNLVRGAGFEIEGIERMPAGYERRLASLDRFGLYGTALRIARLVRPVKELFLWARRPESSGGGNG